ncbi:hypothetical protein BDK51DRAFT_39684 [Blyttiomyces helicus]|uniref:DNA-directed RNA polymerase n=1 Tax=Blyttiomyces helicus TaxID=388810 RepID=A0A4P9WBI9_9FUNG|nr:hypothetical protein BDK51DRAFT_39684 [Blyttiomyces helicus]|eukprot:RKO89622.1 hypothetical protein BDK51DRAFT_39684 [Blyttiomyces helicus]
MSVALLQILHLQPGHHIHADKFLEQELRSIRDLDLLDLPPAAAKVAVPVPTADEAAMAADLDIVGVRRVKEALDEEGGCAVPDQTVALHLAETKSAFFGTPFEGLTGQLGNGAADLGVGGDAMGVESDREIAELVCGEDETFLDLFTPSLEEASKLKAKTQNEALDWIGTKVKRSMTAPWGAPRKSPREEARELLAELVLAHVPVEEVRGLLNFRPKCVYVALMVRRTLIAVREGGIVDDRDFVGNKRLEL